MTHSVASEIGRRITAAEKSYYRLILVVGPGRTGKTAAFQTFALQHGAPLLNVSLLLSERIVDLPRRQRALQLRDALVEILDGTESPLVLLDNIEILFDPELRQNALQLLQSLARRRTIIAAWPGEYSEGSLVYAEAGHSEYRRYAQPDAVVIRTKALD